MKSKKPLKTKLKVTLERRTEILKRSISKKKEIFTKKFNTSFNEKKIDIGKSVKTFSTGLKVLK